MKKIDRLKIYEKYGGRCAYCGIEIKYKAMQIDHYWPQCLSHYKPDEDKNRAENLMPSCRKCNIHKGGMQPEVWRNELSLQVQRLKKNAQFDRALRFSQIVINEKPIVFFFERFDEGK